MADTVFFNVEVITMVDGAMEAEAVAVKDGIIQAVGNLDSIKAMSGDTTKQVDLQGHTLIPGLIEPHTHPFLAALDSYGYINIGAFEEGITAEKAWSKMRQVVEETPKGQWIHANGVNPMLIKGLQSPTRTFLDQISKDHPITMKAVHHHTLFCNSVALEKACVDESTPNPPGGEFGRGSDGRLDGKANEFSAMNLIEQHRPLLSHEEGTKCLTKQAHLYAKHGYTSIAALGLFFNCFENGLDINSKIFGDPNCPVRLVIYHRDVVATKCCPPAKNSPSKSPCVIGVKFWLDGSPYAGTMATKDPYLNTELTRDKLNFAPFPNCGELNFTFDALYEEMLPFFKKGLQIASHAHGERAIDMALDAYEKLLKENPIDDHRMRMEHCGLITKEQLQRAKKLGVTVSFYPDHIHYYGRSLRDDILGEERARRFMPLKWATDIGVKWTLHSDSPCCPLGPFRVLKTVTTRAIRPECTDQPLEFLGEDQVVDVDLALKAYTTNAAWQIFHENQIGSIEQGKIADFTLLSKNPRKVKPLELDTIQVLATYRNGKITSTWKDWQLDK